MQVNTHLKVEKLFFRFIIIIIMMLLIIMFNLIYLCVARIMIVLLLHFKINLLYVIIIIENCTEEKTLI